MNPPKRKKGKSPTQRTLEVLRAEGWTADVVERWMKMPKHPAGGFRKDFLGLIDIVAVKPGEPVLFVQVTDATSKSSHIAKMNANEHLPVLRLCGRVQLRCWRKPTKTYRRHREDVQEFKDDGTVEEHHIARMAVRTKVAREQRELFAG